MLEKIKDPWYETPKWLRIRQSIMRRDCYTDMEAKRYGKRRQAQVVHHIFPKDEFPQYAYSSWNLISLSMKTHDEMHDRDTKELTEKGRDLLRRTCRKVGIPIPEKYLEQKQKKRRNKADGYYYQGSRGIQG